MKCYLLTMLMMGAASPLLAQDGLDAFRRFDVYVSPLSAIRIEGVTAVGAQIGFGYHFNNVIAVVADFDDHRRNDTITTDLFAFRVGPRFSAQYGSRTSLFGHALLGSGQIQRSTESGGVTTSQTINGFSMALGMGVDVGIKHWFGIRVVQLDYDNYRIRGVTGDGYRAGAGVVFRFGK
jgi:hypothetical protein